MGREWFVECWFLLYEPMLKVPEWKGLNVKTVIENILLSLILEINSCLLSLRPINIRFQFIQTVQ